MKEVMDEQRFQVEEYLKGSGIEFLRRMLTIAIHRFSLKINNIVIALETPRGDHKIDIIRFSAAQLSYDKSELVPEQISLDHSESDDNPDLVRKSLSISGPSRLEVFTISEKKLTEAKTTFHAHDQVVSDCMPAIALLNGKINITIDYSITPDLKIDLKTEIPLIRAVLTSSQLDALAYTYHQYQATIEAALERRDALTPKDKRIGSISKKFSGAGSRLAFSKSSASTSSLMMDENLANSKNDFDRRLSESFLAHSFVVPPPPPSTISNVTIKTENVIFYYFPSTNDFSDSKGEEIFFRDSNDFEQPERHNLHYIQVSIADLETSTSPRSQHLTLREVSVFQNFAPRPLQRQHLPDSCKDILPEDGYYRQRIFAIQPDAAGKQYGFSINSQTGADLSVSVGSVSAILPMDLPKLIKQSSKDIYTAVTLHSREKNAKNENFSDKGENPKSSSSNQNEDGIFRSDTTMRKHFLQEHMGQNAAQRFLWDSLFLAESLVFETGAYASTSFQLGNASIILELPLSEDFRFDDAPLMRKERLRLEVFNIDSIFSVLEDNYKPTRKSQQSESQMEEMEPEENEEGSRPYQTLSANFERATLLLEQDWHLFNSKETKTSCIASVEGRSANFSENSAENFLIEFRDYGRDVIGDYLLKQSKRRREKNYMDEKDVSHMGDELDVEQESSENLKRMGISTSLAKHAPFKLKQKKSSREHKNYHDIEWALEALSNQELQVLCAHPAELAVQITVHSTIAHMSPVHYNIIMDAYDTYDMVSNRDTIYEGIEEPRTLFGNSSPILVNFRSFYATLQIYTDGEPLPMASPNQHPSERDGDSDHRPTPSIDLSNISNLRLIQTNRFLRTDRSLLYITADEAELRNSDPGYTSLVTPKRLVREFDTSTNFLTFAFSSQSLASRDDKGKPLRSDTKMIVDLRESVVAWGLSEKWPMKILDVFKRNNTKPKPQILVDRPLYKSYNGEAILDEGQEEPHTMSLTVTTKDTSIAVWGDLDDLESHSSLSSSPLKSKGKGKDSKPSSDANEKDDLGKNSKETSENSLPRLVASPQIVIVPRTMHVILDMNKWIMSASWDRADLFSTIDRNAAKQHVRLAPKQDQRQKVVRGYWMKRDHLPLGAIGTGNFNFVFGSLFSMDYGLELITTPTQLVTLMLLYNSYAKHWMSPSVEPSISEELEESFGASPEAAFSQFLASLSTPSQLEPVVKIIDPIGSAGLGRVKIENYKPRPASCARTTLQCILNPADVVLRLRMEPSTEAEKGARNFDTLDLRLHQFELKYITDENQCALLELSIEKIIGVSQIKPLEEWTFLEFDPSAGQSSLFSALYFSRRTNVSGYEATAPHSLFGPQSGGKTENETFRDLLKVQSSDSSSSSSHMDGDHISARDSSISVVSSSKSEVKYETLRVHLRPLHLSLRFKVFSFLHSIYRDYQNNSQIYGLTTSPQEISKISAESSNAQIQKEDGSALRPYFKKVFVGNVSVRLSVPTMADNQLQLPNLFLLDTYGWPQLSEHLWAVYTPYMRDVMPELVRSLPGLRLVNAVGMGLFDIVTVPISEGIQGRSIAKGFISALGRGVLTTATEVASLGCTLFSTASRGIGAAASLITPSPKMLPEDPDDESDVYATTPKRDAFVAFPSSLPDAAQHSASSVIDGVVGIKDGFEKAANRWTDGEGEKIDAIRESVAAASNVVVRPAQGVLYGAGGLLHSLSQQLQPKTPDERRQIGVKFHPFDTRISALSSDSESDADEWI